MRKISTTLLLTLTACVVVVLMLTLAAKSRKELIQSTVASPRVEVKTEGVSTTGLIWESLSRQFISTVSAY